MSRVEVDFQKSMAQANELDQIAAQMKRLADSNLNGTLQSIAANWVSDNSTRFCQKGKNLENDIVQTAKELEKIAGNIRMIATAAYEAEKKAAEIAKSRTYTT